MGEMRVIAINSFWPLIGAVTGVLEERGYTVTNTTLPALLSLPPESMDLSSAHLVLVGDSGFGERDVLDLVSLKVVGNNPSLPIVIVGGVNILRQSIIYISRGVDECIPASERVERAIARIEPFLRFRMLCLGMARDNHKLRELSMRDELTGLSNRRSFMRDLRRGFELAKRLGEPVSCVIADIDNFKSINDSFGHPGGDKVLVQFASLIGGAKRAYDVVARIGGDEFGWVLINTGRMMAGRVIKRARAALLEHPFCVNDHPINVTASFGVATFHGDGLESYETLIERADRGLYLAKERGKSLIVSCEVGKKVNGEKNSHIP